MFVGAARVADVAYERDCEAILVIEGDATAAEAEDAT
jgi:hypothetical protein